MKVDKNIKEQEKYIEKIREINKEKNQKYNKNVWGFFIFVFLFSDYIWIIIHADSGNNYQYHKYY